MNPQEKQKLIQVGKIAQETVKYAKSIIKKNMLLLEIAEKIEKKIVELGGKPAFPVNLSINEIAAHHTPSHDDKTHANGLLKVDLGVHIDGFIADTAFSIDFENSEENKKLIEASEHAVQAAIESAKKNKTLGEIGQSIQDAITKTNKNFSPLKNLSGHEIKKYNLHAGLTIPNYNNSNEIKLDEGIYAIEPFATSGIGIVYDGKPSGIYHLIQKKPMRDMSTRKVLEFIEKEYSTLPFCSRWLVKKFGTRALMSLKFLEQAEVLRHYSQLVEKSHKTVSQAEHTIFIDEKGDLEVTTG